jgi:hypothetical protein
MPNHEHECLCHSINDICSGTSIEKHQTLRKSHHFRKLELSGQKTTWWTWKTNHKKGQKEILQEKNMDLKKIQMQICGLREQIFIKSGLKLSSKEETWRIIVKKQGASAIFILLYILHSILWFLTIKWKQVKEWSDLIRIYDSSILKIERRPFSCWKNRSLMFAN